MDKQDITSTLSEIGNLLELIGENQFKVRAHLNAARALEGDDTPLETLIVEEKLTEIKGIGKGIAEKIKILAATGAIEELDELRAKVPKGVISMLGIHGVGPKKARTLWQNLEVTSLGELEYACNENRLVALPGFGATSQERILEGIHTLQKYAGRRLLPEALDVAEKLLEKVKNFSGVIRADIVGSLRRRLETVKDINLVASAVTPETVIEQFTGYSADTEVISHDKSSAIIRAQTGIPVNLNVVPDEAFPAALLYFTGAESHIATLSELARKNGFSLDETGFYKGKYPLEINSEEEIYKTLKISYIPPELREGGGEVELAKNSQAPSLIETSDITGIFHCHTTYSDGRESVETMAKECQKLGYSYLGISDHSLSASYAGGLSIEDLARQSEEIDEINEKMEGFHIFKGVESDILKNGDLDYPAGVLDRLDFVIASVHSGFTMSQKEMTKRIIAAIENPSTTMLGHMTGRLLLSREGYQVDCHALIEACAKNGVIIELNSNPPQARYRLAAFWRGDRSGCHDFHKSGRAQDRWLETCLLWRRYRPKGRRRQGKHL